MICLCLPVRGTGKKIVTIIQNFNIDNGDYKEHEDRGLWLLDIHNIDIKVCHGELGGKFVAVTVVSLFVVVACLWILLFGKRSHM